MKNLKGMKSDFCSLENNKLSNLQVIQGGGDTAINTVNTNKGDCPDKETWKDHKLANTIVVGDC